MSNRPGHRDANEGPIVKALLLAGATVERLNMAGVPDLLIGYLGVTLLAEVKNPHALRGSTQARQLTPDQVKWHASWNGHKAIVTSEAEALALLEAVDRADAVRDLSPLALARALAT